MKVSDIVNGLNQLSSTENSDRKKTLTLKFLEEQSRAVAKDKLDLQRRVEPDLVRIQDLQRTYMKNTVSLNGFKEVEKQVSLFKPETAEQADWQRLSRQLNNIVQSTLFEGESVISYLSTSVNDEKSLYTLKMNLQSEIQNVNEKLSSERKQIAGYLVKMENMDTVSRFSAEQTLNDVLKSLNRENAQSLFQRTDKAGSLLANDK